MNWIRNAFELWMSLEIGLKFEEVSSPDDAEIKMVLIKMMVLGHMWVEILYKRNTR